ncbi:MAG: SpoIIE family protein phosphatase [Eubacterium sp.]|nr:SpoIIE family protein phosphatase [Eubacterium sp.]
MNEKNEERRTKFYDWLMNRLQSDDIFYTNEVLANNVIGLIDILLFLASIVIYILHQVRIIELTDDTVSIDYIVLTTAVFCLVPAIINSVFKGRRRFVKVMLLACLVINCAILYGYVNYAVVMFMVIPTILSILYYSNKLTIFISVITGILMGIGTVTSTMYGWLDVNNIMPPKGSMIKIIGEMDDSVRNVFPHPTTFLKDELVSGYLPSIIIFAIVAFVCVNVANRGRRMILDEAKITRNNERIHSELNLANSIQANILPNTFPPFPKYSEFDLYAIMEPAKEVGGDFYDFFMIDETHIAVVIGDVSGKGIPAAMVMVITRTLIKNHAEIDLSPGEVFTRTNKMLAESNEEGLFVTAWMAVIDLTDGGVVYTNAGHNPPIIRKKDKDFEIHNGKPGFVLAGMDGLQYDNFNTKLEPGDELLIYTDGVTEANNENNELYGTERMMNYLNAHKGMTATETLKGLRADVSEFAGEAEQFDDITMLMFKMNDYLKTLVYEEKTFIATDAHLAEAVEYLESQLAIVKASPKYVMQMTVALEEIFVNVCNYAYGTHVGEITVAVKYVPEMNEVRVKFTDSGMPFDPLENEQPDISLSAEERKIGGLGIHMVLQTMDKVTYKYEDGKNILTISKVLD